MTDRKTVRTVLAVAMVAATITAAPSSAIAQIAVAQGGGSYCTNPILGPTEYYRNTWYYSPVINPIGYVPSQATITVLYWTYNIQNQPSGQEVYLCDEVDCVALPTSTGNGSTNHFNGHPANTPFQFQFRVAGSGQLSPWAPTSNLSVCNNFTY